MKTRARSTFIMVCLFIAASFVSTLGVFVPSAMASDDFSPTVPILSMPADGDVVDTTEPTLVWGHEGEAISYRVQVATDTTFVEPLIDEGVDGATAYSVPVDAGLEAGVTYYWRVAAVYEEGGPLHWSAISAFTVEGTEDLPEVPAAPCLLSPQDGARISYQDIENDLESAWLRFASQDGVQTSQIKLSGEFLKEGVATFLDLDMLIDSESFSMIELASGDSGFPQLIAGNAYTWAVRSSFTEDASNDSEEGWSEWSGDWAFAVVAEEPEDDEPASEDGIDDVDAAPKTTTTTTTTRIEHVVTVVTTSYTYMDPQLVYEGSGEVVGESTPVDRSISSTSTENLNQNEDSSKPAKKDGPFLFLGWWWIAVIATVAGAYHFYFRIPTE